jgi:hypothetical protein
MINDTYGLFIGVSVWLVGRVAANDMGSKVPVMNAKKTCKTKPLSFKYEIKHMYTHIFGTTNTVTQASVIYVMSLQSCESQIT